MLYIVKYIDLYSVTKYNREMTNCQVKQVLVLFTLQPVTRHLIRICDIGDRGQEAHYIPRCYTLKRYVLIIRITDWFNGCMLAGC